MCFSITCSSSPQIFHSRCWGEHSFAGSCFHKQMNSCMQNLAQREVITPPPVTKIPAITTESIRWKLTLSGDSSVREEQVFSKSLNISLIPACQHICIGMIFSTLLKIMYCFRYYHYSDISRYIKIFTTIFIILEEEMGYMITYLQYKKTEIKIAKLDMKNTSRNQ